MISSQGISVRLRLGMPTKSGDFAGLAIDTQVPLLVVLIGCATSVAIVVAVGRRLRNAKPEAIEAPATLRRDALGA